MHLLSYVEISNCMNRISFIVLTVGKPLGDHGVVCHFVAVVLNLALVVFNDAVIGDWQHFKRQ